MNKFKNPLNQVNLYLNKILYFFLIKNFFINILNVKSI